MKINLSIVLLLFISTTTFWSQKEKTITDINNKITNNHIELKGSKCSLIAPKDFSISPTFCGLQQTEANASILLTEISSPYDNIIKSFTTENLQVKEMKLDHSEKLLMNGQEAVIFYCEQSSLNIKYSKLILVFGDNKNTIIINGVCKINDTKLFGKIKKSMLSVVYDSSKLIDPLAAVRFEIDVSNSKYKLGKLFSGSILYTVDGNVPTLSDDKSNLLVNASIGKTEVGNKRDFAINIMKGMHNSEIKNDSIKEVKIDGLSGYEIVSLGNDKKTLEPEMVYLLLLFYEYEYFVILGRASNDFDANLKEFRSVGATFKRKN